jgi:leucyl aminopeptidase
MKFDMADAATVFAAIVSAARLSVQTYITGWLALAENMPSGSATRPGDVLRMYGGKTVEVLNTDAEGRLVLADAISRASEDNPDIIVDVATLTTAMMMALGRHTFGIMANRHAVRDKIFARRTPLASKPGRCHCQQTYAKAWTHRSPTSPTPVSAWAAAS